jgi:excisionase family DNA binding protein
MDTSSDEKLTHKFALSVADASQLSSVGRSQIYEAIASGELRAVKRGRSTLILPADLRAWIENLPAFSAETKSSQSAAATQARKKSKEIEAPATPSRREAAADRARSVAQRANPRRALAAAE